ncbi:MAG: hypothetical protein RR385_09625 [Clostridiales bacterium]
MENLQKQKAIKKINKEKETKPTGNKAAAVMDAVAEALLSFAKQDKEFAQAIVQTDKTIGDCCEEIMNGVGSSISDLEVYRKAVQFYFPGADIQMKMTIDLCASVNTPSDKNKHSSAISLDLSDFL